MLIVAPLFAEHNRCRWLLAETARQLARQGVDCWVMDLPGLGESPTALASVGWSDWLDAVAAASAAITARAPHTPLLVGIRGGALLCPGGWQLASVPGATLLRHLDRLGPSRGGYDLTPALIDGLAAAAAPQPSRVVRLTSDGTPADHRIEGPALWRRAEPGRSVELARAMADDIANWAKTCAVR